MTAESDAEQAVADRLDALALNVLESHAKWLKYSAESIATYAGQVRLQRPFETRMEEALDQAEAAMKAGLVAVELARQRYKSLPMWQPGEQHEEVS